MATQTPATSSQPRNRPDSTTTAVRPGARRDAPHTSGLRRASWWCLAAWPVLFLLFVVISQQIYPDGYDPASSSAGAAFGILGGVLLFAPPLASLVLSAVDFHRTRTRRALVPAWILLALVAVWDLLFAREVANWSDVNWWVFIPTVIVAVAIASAIAWPQPKGRVGT